MNDKKNATIYDIAKLSGFSPKTVARVINNEKNVAKTTEEKILGIVKELHYSPNNFARNLKTKKDKTILISVRTIHDFPIQWLQMMIEQIGLLCMKRKITLITEYYYSAESLENSIIKKSSNYIDGAILFYEDENDLRIKMLQDHGTPFIIFEKAYNSGVSYIGNDNHQALFSIFDMMCKNHLSSACMLLWKPTLVNTDRVKGVLDAFEANGIPNNRVQVAYGIQDAKSAYTFIMDNFNNGGLPDVFFISGDERVPGVYKAFHQLGVRIPEDVSILGFDDIPYSEFLLPRLTTIRPDYKKLSNELIRFFDKTHIEESNTRISVPTIFIARDSVDKKYGIL